MPHRSALGWRSCSPSPTLPFLVTAALLLGACGGPDRVPPTPSASAQVEAYAAFLEGEMLARAGDLGGAALAYVDAVRADPHVWPPRLALAEVLHRAGEQEEALFALDGAASRGAPIADTTRLRTRILVASDDMGGALAAWARADDGTHEPSWYRAWMAHAREAGDLAAQERAARAWSAAHPAQADPWRSLAAAVRRDQGAAAAAAIMEEALARPDASAADASLHVQHLTDADDIPSAILAAERCIERFPSHLPCHRQIVALLDRDALPGDPVGEDVRERLAAYALRAGRDPDLLFGEGRALLQSSRPALAELYAVRIAQARPWSPRHLERAAWVAWEARRWETAVDIMLQVVEIEPRNPDALNFVGYVWADNSVELDRAEIFLRDALALRPGDAAIMDSLAWALFRQGRVEEALPLQQEAIERDDAHALLHDHLAQMLLALGRAEEARAAWERAIEVAGAADAELVEQIRERLRALDAGEPVSDSSVPRVAGGAG